MKLYASRFSYFGDTLDAIREGLEWLESQAAKFDPAKPGYREFHLVCALEHLDYFEILPLDSYPRLRAIVERVGADPIVRKASPESIRPKAKA